MVWLRYTSFRMCLCNPKLGRLSPLNYDYIDFTEKGVFEIEFLNKKGEPLASKRLEIK